MARKSRMIHRENTIFMRLFLLPCSQANVRRNPHDVYVWAFSNSRWL